MDQQTPIQIHIPPSLRHLTVPLSTFLAQNRQYTNLAVGAFIFVSSNSTTPALRLLIVQRAASERGFPNLWEVPGGSCEASDPTVLHSLARETFEETGLRLMRFNRQIGSGVDFVTGYGARERRWRKLSFEIEVAEIQGGDMGCGKLEEHDKVWVNGDKGEGEDGVDGPHGVDGAEKDGAVHESSVTLNPEEHQAYAWVTENEIEQGIYSFVTIEQKDVMLEAFRLRKENGIR